ncbi:hypothetical protein D9619_005267 [Psilocybe cf. subviscida]|uniref:Golgi apyrase n=1 Tax=Psilocybe cf. subviscida TaxID=2480587 RepID=A0A8H5BXX3_9AGAR|nr:hypothetical protein D9619_005267 [Psilocybe cf. subviscida]
MRRTSAKIAQQSFAEQLDSDDSDGGSTDGLGASATRLSRVSAKRKYSKRAKTTDASASREESKRSGSKGKGKARPPSPEAVSSPMLPPIASVPAEPSTRPRPRPVPKRSGPPLPVLAVDTAPQLLADEMSPLTSLSSVSEQGSFATEIPESPPKSFPSPTASIPAPPIPSPARASKPFPGPSKVPAWSLPKVGSYSWVLVDKRTFKVHEPEGHNTSEGDEKVWWPAKWTQRQCFQIDKHSQDNSVEVFLFGKGRGMQNVLNPSQENVLSYHDTSYLPRFLVPKFVVPSSIIDLTSPRKKPKIDRGALERKWDDAVRELKDDKERSSTIIKSSKPFEHDEDDADDSDASLPEFGKLFSNLYEATLHTATLPRAVTSKKKGKRKRGNGSDMSNYEDAGDFGAVDEDIWVPPEPEHGLDLPDELVLSRDRPSRTVDYWPAKLLEYIPPTNRKQAPRYRVTWLDDTEGIVERSWFYTMREDGFGTCKLGQFQSSFSEVQNDADDEGSPQRRPRSPSPVIQDPSPSAKEFASFGIRLQFQYTKEVLKAILANEYGPTRRKHVQFIKGGNSKQSAVKDSTSRGRMDPGEVTLLLVFIKDWCLRDETRVTPDLHVDTSLTHVDDIPTTDTTPRASSPIVVDSFPSSPPEPPPSSLPPSRIEREDSVLSDISHPGPADTLSVITEPLSELDDTLNSMSGSVALDSQDSASRVGQRIRVSRDFESLSSLQKQDYCLNMLVPEAVRQILLWRTGQRTSVSLLTPTEEEDLYERGEALVTERDWVHDIMRYRNLMNKPQQEQQLRGRALGHNRTSSGSRLRKNSIDPVCNCYDYLWRLQQQETHGSLVDISVSSLTLIYSWKDPRSMQVHHGSELAYTLPKVEKGTQDNEQWVTKVEPGLSSLEDNPEDVGTYLRPLLAHAREHVPPSLQQDTPLFLLATAGMRLLSAEKQANILLETCRFLVQHSNFRIDSPSLVGPCGSSVRIITGEEEGLFGWIAVNYLMDGFTGASQDRTTYGFLDMGGASTQIAFEPSSKNDAQTKDLVDVRLRLLGGDEIHHKVFVTTWLGYGTNQARERYIGKTISEFDATQDLKSAEADMAHHLIPDPCLPKDLQLDEQPIHLTETSTHVKERHRMIGTGSFEQCMKKTAPLLNTQKPCPDTPCLMNGVHVPPIDFSVSHFIGVSEYWYSSEHIFGLGGAYDFVEYERAASAFCSRDWADIMKEHEQSSQQHHLGGDGEVIKDGKIIGTGQWGPQVEVPRLQMQCFKAAWIANVLHEGIKMPRIVDQGGNDTTESGKVAAQAAKKGLGRPIFQSVDTVGDIAISWTLGKMVLEASKEVPPRSKASKPIVDPIDDIDDIEHFPIQPILFPTLSLGGIEHIISPHLPDSLSRDSLGFSPVLFLLYVIIIFLLVGVVFPLRRQLRSICLRSVRKFTHREDSYNTLLEEGKIGRPPSPTTPTWFNRILSFGNSKSKTKIPLSVVTQNNPAYRHMAPGSIRASPTRALSLPAETATATSTQYISRSPSPSPMFFDDSANMGGPSSLMSSRSRNGSQINLSSMTPRLGAISRANSFYQGNSEAD